MNYQPLAKRVVSVVAPVVSTRSSVIDVLFPRSVAMVPSLPPAALACIATLYSEVQTSDFSVDFMLGWEYDPLATSRQCFLQHDISVPCMPVV